MVGVSLGPLTGLVIGTGEGYVVGLSLLLTLGSPLDYPNLGLTGIILGISLVNPLGFLNYIWHISWCGPWIVT